MDEIGETREFELKASTAARAISFSVAFAACIAGAALGSILVLSSIAKDFADNPLYMAPILACVALVAWLGSVAYGRLVERPARFSVSAQGLGVTSRGAKPVFARWDQLPAPRMWRSGSGGKPDYWVEIALPGERPLKLRASSSEWEAGCSLRLLAEEIARRTKAIRGRS